MPVTAVTIEGVPVPRNGNAKPRIVVRGRRRTALIGAINHLKSLANQDAREARKGSRLRYTPFLILGEENSRVNRAFVTLQAALKDAKARRA